MNPRPDVSGDDARPLRGRLLGAFVCFQLVAIPLGNFIKLVPVRQPEHRGEICSDLQRTLGSRRGTFEPFQTIFDTAAYACSRWAEVSGQGQSWALFSAFGTRAVFPVVELRWPDRETVRIRCYFEPADPTHYAYAPEPCCRWYNYEYRMVVFHMIRPEDFPSPEHYRREGIDCARDMRHSIGAFLRYRTGRYLAEHPGTPLPESVTLVARVLPDPPAGASRLDRPEPVEYPFARWWPGRPVESGFGPLEGYDLFKQEFVRVLLGAQP